MSKAANDLTGRVNAWVCDECDQPTLAIHICHGVTPFMLDCRATEGCKGIAQSMFYPKPTPPPHVLDRVEWEWFKPSRKWAKKRDRRIPGTLAHHDQGGLEIRAITPRGRDLVERLR